MDRPHHLHPVGTLGTGAWPSFVCGRRSGFVRQQLNVWGTNHHVHDQRKRLGPEVLEMLDKYFCDWCNRHQSLAVEVDDGTSGAGYKLWYMRYGRLLIGKPALEVNVPSGFVHSTGTSILMSRGLFKLHNLALQWQRDTASASHGEEVSQIIRDTLLEAGIQFREEGRQ